MANKLSTNLKELITIYLKIFYYIPKFQKKLLIKALNIKNMRKMVKLG